MFKKKDRYHNHGELIAVLLGPMQSKFGCLHIKIHQWFKINQKLSRASIAHNWFI